MAFIVGAEEGKKVSECCSSHVPLHSETTCPGYLGEYESLKRDVAHFALGKEGPFNVDPRVYIHGLARPIPKRTSPQQIRKFVDEGAQKVNQSAFEEAYKEAFEIAELMAEFGHRPNSYSLHSDHQDFPKVVPFSQPVHL